jgi:hypothetical protein
MRTIQQMVDQEVQCDLSSLVSTLAQGYGAIVQANDLPDLCEQAAELAAPVPDYEEAAIQAGWQKNGSVWVHDDFENAETSPENACHKSGIEPIDSEVYEHWAVSQWLAKKLIEHGEKVDTDFAGLNVWARQTAGQQISADRVIERIYAATHQKEEA